MPLMNAHNLARLGFVVGEYSLVLLVHQGAGRG